MKIGRVHLVPEVTFRGNLRTKLHKKIHILYFVVFKITLVAEDSKEKSEYIYGKAEYNKEAD